MKLSFTKISALAFSIFLFANNSNAQQINRCATDEKVTNHLAENPAAVQNYFQLIENARTIKQEREAGLRGGSGLTMRGHMTPSVGTLHN